MAATPLTLPGPRGLPPHALPIFLPLHSHHHRHSPLHLNSETPATTPPPTSPHATPPVIPPTTIAPPHPPSLQIQFHPLSTPNWDSRLALRLTLLELVPHWLGVHHSQQEGLRQWDDGLQQSYAIDVWWNENAYNVFSLEGLFLRNFLKDRMLWFLLLIVKRFLRREIDLDSLHLWGEVYSLSILQGLTVFLEVVDYWS